MMFSFNDGDPYEGLKSITILLYGYLLYVLYNSLFNGIRLPDGIFMIVVLAPGIANLLYRDLITESQKQSAKDKDTLALIHQLQTEVERLKALNKESTAD